MDDVAGARAAGHSGRDPVTAASGPVRRAVVAGRPIPWPDRNHHGYLAPRVLYDTAVRAVWVGLRCERIPVSAPGSPAQSSSPRSRAQATLTVGTETVPDERRGVTCSL